MGQRVTKRLEPLRMLLIGIRPKPNIVEK